MEKRRKKLPILEHICVCVHQEGKDSLQNTHKMSVVTRLYTTFPRLYGSTILTHRNTQISVVVFFCAMLLDCLCQMLQSFICELSSFSRLSKHTHTLNSITLSLDCVCDKLQIVKATFRLLTTLSPVESMRLEKKSNANRQRKEKRMTIKKTVQPYSFGMCVCVCMHKCQQNISKQTHEKDIRLEDGTHTKIATQYNCVC